MFGSLTLAFAAVEPMGVVAYGDLEKEVRDTIKGYYDPKFEIKFFKGQ